MGRKPVATKKVLSFPLPDSPKDVIKLADWLEIHALISPDGNASRGDLERPLKRASIFQSATGNESNDIDEAINQAFLELEERLISTGDGYPFQIIGGILHLRDNPRNFPAYIFCLFLSYFKWTQKKNAKINPWKLFEELSCRAAGHYMRGDVFWFAARGSGKKNTAKRKTTLFQQNVSGLSTLIGEGNGFKSQPTLNSQDDKVDLVAWRDFPDRHSSKLIMFGQCAGGNNWADKTAELQPERFWDQWMQDGKVSPLIRSFYMPYRIPRIAWTFHARSAGILFDRCRIAYWTRNAEDILTDKRYMDWCGSVAPIRQ
ncbi:MAG: hypothetical protein NTX59_02830 [Elusimicrobia bacterium]|nr:hypothetical protein [Elusimicrobiota bacterium]